MMQAAIFDHVHSALLPGLGVALSGITTDSRQIRPGMAFAAYPGEAGDGRRYIAAAIQAGAAAILWEPADFSWPSELGSVPNLAITGLKNTVGNLAAQIYDHPSRDLWVMGITGTNGKTSCSQWLTQGFTALSRKTAVVGTLGNGFPPALELTGNTTPDAAVLQAALADFRAQHAQAVAIEVSSHGLEQGRVNGMKFDVAVLTNLTRDHLDYHGDMASYARAKARLFAWPDLRYAVLNLDDDFGQELAARHQQDAVQIVGYGFEQGNVRGRDLKLSPTGLAMTVDTDWGRAELQSVLLGRFNAHNLLACLATMLVSDISLADAVSVLSKVTAVTGRMQTMGGGEQPLVVIDYAHTPDALEKALMSLRELNAAGRIWCIFGCGGERDAGKRPLMGAIATRWADQVIITSDNPRNENALDIIAAIRAGANGQEMVVPDRARAIAEVIRLAQAGDVVLIAGKGHEDYQEIAGVKYPFNDAVIARQALEARL